MAEITEKELNELFARANAELKEAEAFGTDIVVLALYDLWLAMIFDPPGTDLGTPDLLAFLAKDSRPGSVHNPE